ncbi:MAG: FUN14 domain-containing protein [Thermoproteota archaeon]|nr:FUN14 domain-containing protein [Thermoproteota archaeon]
MNGVLTSIIYQLGLGGLGGFIIGYAVKKLTKLLAILTGLFFLALAYLGYKGVITIKYEELTEAVKTLIGATGKAVEWLVPIIASLPFTGSLIVGFLLGLKTG